jgi:hypothetical protein
VFVLDVGFQNNVLRSDFDIEVLWIDARNGGFGTRENIDFAPLIDRDLCNEKRSGAKAKNAEPAGIPGSGERSESDQARAQPLTLCDFSN